MANFVMRPNADVDTGWTTSTTSRFAALTEAGDNVVQPTAPSPTHVISSAAANAAQKLDLTAPTDVGTATAAELRIYWNTSRDECSTVTLANAGGTVLGRGVVTNTTTYGWKLVSVSVLTLTQADVNGLRLRLTATKVGGGGMGTVRVAAAYIDLTYTPIVIHQGAGIVNGASSVTAAGRIVKQTSALITNTSSVISTARVLKRASANVVSTSSIAATATGGRTPPLDLSNRGFGFSFRGKLFPYVAGEGSGDLSWTHKGKPLPIVATLVVGVTTHDASGIIASTSTITGTARRIQTRLSTGSSEGTVTAVGTRILHKTGASVLSAEGGISAQSIRIQRGISTLSSEGIVAAVGTKVETAAVIITYSEFSF